MNPLRLPLVAAQGLWVRSRTAPLPEASGPLTGIVESRCAPAGPGLRLVVVGESTAAGCGAPTHEAGFTGAFARALAEQRHRSVHWTVHGRFGATIRRVRFRMLPEIEPDLDVAVLLIGVNDVLARTSEQRWSDDLSCVLDTLTVHASSVVVPGVPPFGAFPSLPRALRSYLAERGRLLDDVARRMCATRTQTRWIDSTDVVPTGREQFADDGFHPSPAGYHRWAEAVSSRLA